MGEAIKINKMAKLHLIHFNDHRIVGSLEELEDLCLALEEYLYDEMPYMKLQDEVDRLMWENRRLRDKLANYTDFI